MTSGTKINRPRVGILCLRSTTFWEAVCKLSGQDQVKRSNIIGTDDAIYHRISSSDDMRGQRFDAIHDLLEWDRADATIAQKLRDNVRHRIKETKGEQP